MALEQKKKTMLDKISANLRKKYKFIFYINSVQQKQQNKLSKDNTNQSQLSYTCLVDLLISRKTYTTYQWLTSLFLEVYHHDCYSIFFFFLIKRQVAKVGFESKIKILTS